MSALCNEYSHERQYCEREVNLQVYGSIARKGQYCEAAAALRERGTLKSGYNLASIYGSQSRCEEADEIEASNRVNE